MNEFGGLSHPKTPKKIKKHFTEVGIIITYVWICMTLKTTLWFVQKWFQERLQSESDCLGFPIFSSKGNSTPIGLDENGQDSMLDAPWAIPKHKHVISPWIPHKISCVWNLLQYLSWVNGYSKWISSWVDYSIVNHTQISYNPLYHQNNLLMANPIVSKISPVV